MQPRIASNSMETLPPLPRWWKRGEQCKMKKEVVVDGNDESKDKVSEPLFTGGKITTVSVPFLFKLAAISGGFGLLSSLVIAVCLGQLPLWPLQYVSRYVVKRPGAYLFRFCSALSGFCTFSIGAFGYLQRQAAAATTTTTAPKKKKKRTAFAWCAIFCGIGITGINIVPVGEHHHDIHGAFAKVFFVSGAVLSSLEAVHKKSRSVALSSLVMWISLISFVVSQYGKNRINIVVLTAGGKTGIEMRSLFSVFASIVFVVCAVLSSLEAVYKKSCPTAFSSLVIWISLINTVVLTAGGKTGIEMRSVCEWTAATLFFGLMHSIGESEESISKAAKANISAANQINNTATEEMVVLLDDDDNDDARKEESKNTNKKEDDDEFDDESEESISKAAKANISAANQINNTATEEMVVLLDDDDNDDARKEESKNTNKKEDDDEFDEDNNNNPAVPTITVSVPFLFRVAAISGGIGCFSVVVVAVFLGQQPLWPLRDISRYAENDPGIYLFRFCSALCGFSTVSVGSFGYLGWATAAVVPPKKRKRTVFLFARAVAVILCGIGIIGAGLVVSCNEFPALYLAFVAIFFVSSAVWLSLEAVHKKSCLLALSGLVVWFSLIDIVLIAVVEGKTGSVVVSVLEWLIVALLFGLMPFVGRDKEW